MSEFSANRNELKMLGVRIDNLARGGTENWVKNILSNLPEQKFVTTLNPEILLKARKDSIYRDILNGADLNLCDGFGIKFVSWLRGEKIKARYTGVELTDFLLKRAKERGLLVLVAVAKNSLSKPKEIEQGIERKYNLKARAKYIDEIFFDSEDAKSAQIVFVNFGAPDQEEFIFKNRGIFPNAKILVGVGGTFDFLTGKMKRAPRSMRRAGLEWLFRLWQEPKRARRIWNAVAVFPVLAVFGK